MRWRGAQLIVLVSVLATVPHFASAQIYRELEITTVNYALDEVADEVEELAVPADVDDDIETVSQVTATQAEKILPVTENFESFIPFDERFVNGAVMDTGDVNGDGEEEIVVMQSGGEDALSELHVYSADGELLAQSIPYQKVWVGEEHSIAVGDIDGDGEDEIAISRPRGEDSSVLILNGDLEEDLDSKSVIKPFSSFFTEMDYGVSVDIANVLSTATSGDVEKEEIIVATGEGAAPQIAVLNEKGKELVDSIVPYADTDTHGLSIAAVYTTGEETADIFVGFLNPGKTNVKSYAVRKKGDHPVLTEFTVWESFFDTGVRMEGIDINNDGTEEVAITPAGDAPAEIRFYRGDGQLAQLESNWAYEDSFLGGIDMAVLQIDTESQLLTIPTHQRDSGTYFDANHWIEVNVSDQTTTLWENGYAHKKYYISSGLPGTPTPLGEFSILKKLPTHVYDGRPEYFYPNTKWNLRYKAGSVGRNYYFHTAYWHDNFGNRMSHGCVNMREDEAEYLYNWADLGTPVWIHE